MKRMRDILILMSCLFLLLPGSMSIAQTGAVLGFGNNMYGEIGDNTTTNRTLATAVFHVSGIKAVACGYSHTLALDSEGIVWAWGDNYYGQVGNGDTSHADQLQPVAVLSGIKAIAAGTAHSLALDYAGRVWAWGFNAYGNLGVGDTTPRYSPALMAGSFATRAKAISAGETHSLVLAENGILYGCGGNAFGQLAQGDFWNRYYLTYMASTVSGMSAGGYHTLAQLADNNVIATGYNGEGELGDGTGVTQNHWVWIMSNARSISAGLFHNLAVSQRGLLYSWGRNTSGELGMNDASNRLLVTQVSGLTNIKAVAAGSNHSLILTAQGTVFSTGRNNEGQLGNGTKTSRQTFAAVRGVSLIGSIAAGGLHSIILKPFTNVMATGLNNHGQLGLGHLRQQTTPVWMSHAGTNIIAIASGSTHGNHSLMLMANGTVMACGMNTYGQLGNGTTTDSALPVQVKGPNGVGVLSNIIAIAAGDNHSLALSADGTIYSWGRGDKGQLGNGSWGNFSVPTLALYVSNVFAIAAGGEHSLALGNQGILYSAGYNASGQLGHGDTQNHIFFDVLDGFFYQTAVTAGGNHSMSLNGAGQIYAWGSNYIGQLGLGDAADRHFPTLEPGTAAIGIAAAGSHSMHVNAAGEVYVTGFNPFGELGLGDTQARFSWTYNSAVSGIAAGVAGGLFHSMSVNAFGTLTATGLGSNGQLGNGTTQNMTSFFPVNGGSGVIAMAGGESHSLFLTAPQIGVVSNTIKPATVKGGAGAVGTITLNGVAGPGGQRVYLFSYSVDQNNKYVTGATVPSYVDFPAGSKTATYTMTTKAVPLKTVTYVDAYLNTQSLATLTINP